jgi:hypothetical protein
MYTSVYNFASAGTTLGLLVMFIMMFLYVAGRSERLSNLFLPPQLKFFLQQRLLNYLHMLFAS